MEKSDPIISYNPRSSLTWTYKGIPLLITIFLYTFQKEILRQIGNAEANLDVFPAIILKWKLEEHELTKNENSNSRNNIMGRPNFLELH